ncbi:hypothetical protein PAAG_06184 [Paracoccidioides lutzii Pb01]|uniref:Uncharacterized protein n=1 Tax=Paracoccidioides lutzii (strain ATCC MYA-826 / Pb01) TaxID=502779 RepID=C1H674_PARBA|nr:hypothetical protein PAAG_06184 [Paracoccidioides lutzii Pb01]EEH35137.2 hypothetical protein PAAG_06184 [Paracoccidioides lutzii Pb01]
MQTVAGPSRLHPSIIHPIHLNGRHQTKLDHLGRLDRLPTAETDTGLRSSVNGGHRSYEEFTESFHYSSLPTESALSTLSPEEEDDVKLNDVPEPIQVRPTNSPADLTNNCSLPSLAVSCTSLVFLMVKEERRHYVRVSQR